MFKSCDQNDGNPSEMDDLLCSGKLAIATETEPVSPAFDTSELCKYDVVCGRQKEAFNWVGNRRFRITVSLALNRYMQAPSKKYKTHISEETVNLVRECGGRFLERRCLDIDGDEERWEWVELDRNQTHRKVAHAVRDMVLANTVKRKVASPKTTPSSIRAIPFSTLARRKVAVQPSDESTVSESDQLLSFDTVVNGIVEPIAQPRFSNLEFLMDDTTFARMLKVESQPSMTQWTEYNW